MSFLNIIRLTYTFISLDESHVMSSHWCLLESCNRLLLLLFLVLSAVCVCVSLSDSSASATLKHSPQRARRFSPLKCVFLPACLRSAVLMSPVTLAGSFQCWCDFSTFIHFDTFLQSTSMRARWSYIAWICVFSLGAFRTFCIPSNEGKTWGNLGNVVFAGIWWLMVIRKENIQFWK